MGVLDITNIARTESQRDAARRLTELVVTVPVDELLEIFMHKCGKRITDIGFRVEIPDDWDPNDPMSLHRR